MGTGSAFDAQKQFLANIEDAINSAVDIPSSIDRYQSTLQYARSKLDFVVGHGLYMLPSDMSLHVGTLNGYNNLIQIATDDMDLGYNEEVNEETSGIKSPEYQLESEDFDFQPKTSEKKVKSDQSEVDTSLDTLLDLDAASEALDELTHDEKKLLIILGFAAIGTAFTFLRK